MIILREKNTKQIVLLLDTKIEIKYEVDHHMAYLTSIHVEGQALKALMKERKDLIQVKKDEGEWRKEDSQTILRYYEK